MLMLTDIVGRGKSRRFQPAIEQLGLKNGLQLCLDSSDIRSYPGSGQFWNDTSGNGNHFWLGIDASVTGAEPTLSGNAGEIANSWGFDGADFFRLSIANTAFIDSMHQNNALFTIAGWVQVSGFSANQGVFATSETVNNPGIRFWIDTAQELRIDALKSGSPAVFTAISTALITAGAWTFVAAAVDEAIGANGARLAVNGTVEQFNSTYTSPSAAVATRRLEVASLANASNFFLNGGRLGSMAAWNRALSSDELIKLFNRTRGRFGV